MYFSISKSKSKFYSTSKEPREGYEKITYGSDNSVTYHKYVDTVEGILTKVSVEQKTIRGAELSFLSIELKTAEGYSDYISCTLKEYGRFTEQAKAMASALNGASFGELYRFSVKTRKSNDSDRSFLNIYVNDLNKLDESGKPVSTGFIPSSEIPKAEVSVDELGQKTTKYDNQNAFFTGIVAGLLKKAKEYSGSPAPTTPKEPATFDRMSDPLQGMKVSLNALDEFLNS